MDVKEVFVYSSDVFGSWKALYSVQMYLNVPVLGHNLMYLEVESLCTQS